MADRGWTNGGDGGRRFGRRPLAQRAAERLAAAGPAMGAGAAAGFLASLVSSVAANAPLPVIGSTLAGMAGALAIRLGREHLAAVRARLFDSPAADGLLAHLRRFDLDVGVTAARRGGAWVVYRDPTSEPVLLSDHEYGRFRDGFRQLNEITASGDTVTVRRYREGLLDSSHTAAPAVTTHSIANGSTLSRAYYVAGHEASEPEALQAYEAYRIEHPRGAHERIRFNSSRIAAADAARETASERRRSWIARELDGLDGPDEAPAPSF